MGRLTTWTNYNGNTNLYLLYNIYLDQHRPIPLHQLNLFINNIQQQIISKQPSWSCIKDELWYTPKIQGGLGLIDLRKQLLRRRAYFIYISIHDTVTYPYYSTLIRVNLQNLSIINTLYNKIASTSMDFITLRIDNLDTNSISLLTKTASIISTTENNLSTSSIQIINVFTSVNTLPKTFNYSLLFRSQYIQHQHNQIETDIIINIPYQFSSCVPMITYLLAWDNMIEEQPDNNILPSFSH